MALPPSLQMTKQMIEMQNLEGETLRLENFASDLDLFPHLKPL
jgi:hypothetical protein